ncbi:flagellin [Pirellulaceae bacterium SH449]
MTRINTNVSSLTAQTRLQRTNNDLQTSLTRLSTGLRINSGKDDPAGLIASESLRSDITSINKALTNTQRASQIIATADSALGQVSNLLNDIRGLVTEAANRGALSDNEIEANQIQIDSSLAAINRIAQTTTFQGRKLLDGSLEFVTQAGTGFSTVSDLKINQANLGATGSVGIQVEVSSAARQAEIRNSDIAASVASSKATGSISFGTAGPATEAVIDIDLANSFNVGAEASRNVQLANAFTPNTQAKASISLAGGTITFDIEAIAGEAADGLKGNSTVVNVVHGAGAQGTGGAAYDASTNTLTINIRTGDETADIAGYVNALDEFSTSNSGGAGTATAADAGVRTGLFTLGSDTLSAATNLFKLTAVNGGLADGEIGNNTVLEFTSGTTTGAVFDSTANRITVTVANNATISQIAAAINTDLAGDFIASDVQNGTYRFSATDNGVNTAGGPFAGGTNVTAAGRIRLVATDGGPADGARGNLTDVKFVTGSATSATYDTKLNRLIVTVAENATVNDVATAINNDGTFQVVPGQTLNGTARFDRVGDIGVNTPTVVTPGSEFDGIINITSNTASGDFNKSVSFVTSNALSAGQVQARLDGDGNIEIVTRENTAVTLTAIRDAINTLDNFTATLNTSGATGDQVYNVGADNAPTIVDLTGGQGGGGLNENVTFQLTGRRGSQEVQLNAGASLAQIVSAVNSYSDTTGVEAVNDAGTLVLRSTDFGSKSFVDVKVLNGLSSDFTTGLSATRSNGADIVATVNGFAATGNGNTISLTTSTLDISMTVAAGSDTTVNFNITGGGALFQLGGDVVSSQQARLGIGSLSTSRLGGVSGRLSELGKGQAKSLVNDITGAANVIDEVINQVTSLRGRLGAFQRTTLESNMTSLTDTLTNLSEAQSTIRDADFAKESAALTRAQILVQSGTSVLGIANQSSQSVLSLLR